MELIAYSSVIKIPRYYDEEDIYNDDINYNSVARKVSDFDVPLIFYNLQKSCEKRKGKVFVHGSCDTHPLDETNGSDNIERDNVIINGLLEKPCHKTFTALYENPSENLTAEKADSLFNRPPFIDPMNIQERILINPRYNKSAFLWHIMQERILLESLKSVIYKYNVQKLQIKQDTFQEIMNTFFVTHNKIYFPRLQSNYDNKFNNNSDMQNLNITSLEKNSSSRINLNKQSFSSGNIENIENNCSNSDPYILEIKKHFQDDIISEDKNNDPSPLKNEQSYNLNELIYQNQILNLNSKSDEILCEKNTISQNSNIAVTINEEIEKNKFKQQIEENGSESNLTSMITTDPFEISDFKCFEVVDSWHETDLPKIENIQTRRNFKSSTVKEDLKSQTSIINQKVGEKRKAGSDLDDKENFSSTTDSKLKKFYHGDKASNLQYFNAIRNAGTLYSDNIDLNCNSTKKSRNRFVSEFDWNPTRSDFDLNRCESDENYFVNRPKRNFGSKFFGKQQIVPFMNANNEWYFDKQRQPEPHLNFNIRQTVSTWNQIKSIASLIFSSSTSNINDERCHLPVSLINNRIHNMQMQCNELEMRMNNLDCQRQYGQQSFNHQFGPYFQSFDDNVNNASNMRIDQQMKKTFSELTQCRAMLNRLENIREEMITIYDDMLAYGVTDSMLTHWQEVEVIDLWERLSNYEKIYGRRNN